MLKNIIFLIIILQYNYTYSQINLVPNGSFEDTISCPNNLQETNKCKYWYDLGYCSADYFNSCSSNTMINVPANYFGHQLPKTGNAYCGFYSFIKNTSNSSYREGIYTRLLSKLIKDVNYHIEFYVSLGDSMQYAIKNIDVSLTDTISNSFSPCSGYPSTLTPIYINNSNYYSDKINWIKVEGNFIATGNEIYIAISNFKDNNNTEYEKLNYSGDTLNTDYTASYYYIDDVKVFAIDNEITNECKNGEVLITPNNDGLNDFFKINTQNYKEFTITVFNRWGNIIYSSKTIPSWDGKYKSNLCASGTYFFLFEGILYNNQFSNCKGYIQLIY